MPSHARRSRCPVACTLDVLGDRWSLLVVRDLVRGKRRYAEFLESPEGIPTNILADRLKRLASSGIITSRTTSRDQRSPSTSRVQATGHCERRAWDGMTRKVYACNLQNASDCA